MYYRRVIYSLSIILMIVGLAMLLPLFCSLYYGEYDSNAWALSCGVTYLVGLIGFKKSKLEGSFHIKEVFFIVTLGWLLASLFGSLPYVLAGIFPTYADAFFETMSGFTTTGASVLIDIEALSHGLLLWRSLTNWLGGMGIIVLFIALFPSVGTGGMQMFQAELPGGSFMKKLKPRISETAKILWSIYLFLTITQTLLMWLLGMPLFDALCHSFSTVATAGFSTKNASIGCYNSAIQWVIIVFMYLSGVNFTLYYQAFRAKSLGVYGRNGEFKLYTFFILLGILLVIWGNYASSGFTSGYTVEETIRHAAFQVVSISTTTGFATVDYNHWSYFAQAVLVILMFIGGCTGSTSSSIKVGRILVLLKQAKLELTHALHPRAVLSLKLDEKNFERDSVVNILQYFFLFLAIIGLGTVVMTFWGLDLVTSFTATIAVLGNIGPGLVMVGPIENYAFLPEMAKYFLSFLMLLGRLEIYTVLVLFMPSFWRKG